MLSVRVWIRLAALAALVSLLLFTPRAALAGFTPPPMRDAVTDTSGKLTEAEDQALEERITAYRNRTGNEIAVLVTGSLEGDSIEDVAYGTFNSWGIGKKGLDNGVLLVIAPTERRTRIETGKGVGDRLTDIECAEILRERVGPLLKQERFREAIEAALEAIEASLDSRASPALPSSIVAMPFVRGAYVVDAAGALPDEVVAKLEENAAREGRYWCDFAIVVVNDLDAPVDPQVFVEIEAKRTKMPSAYMAQPAMQVRLSAADRKVAVHGIVVWHTYEMEARVKRLNALASGAPTLADALQAVAADQAAEGKRRQDRAREDARAEAQRQVARKSADRSLLIALAVGVALLIGLPILIIVILARRAARRGGSSYGSSYGSSSSDTSYASSSYESSSSCSSSSSSSSSTDTSYSGGGGSSGGGGASDSY